METTRLFDAPVAALAFAAAAVFLSATGVAAAGRQIDAAQSKLTVFAYKSGLFSALADDHVIRAPIAGGWFSETAPLGVELTVHSKDLEVLDPALAASKRADVQARMISAEVLDTAKYPEITFISTSVEPAGAEQWRVVGRLTIHGVTKPVTLTASRQGNGYRGSVEILQRDFGIEPISIGGGVVKVKDALKIEFEIVGRAQ